VPTWLPRAPGVISGSVRGSAESPDAAVVCGQHGMISENLPEEARVVLWKAICQLEALKPTVFDRSRIEWISDSMCLDAAWQGTGRC